MASRVMDIADANQIMFTDRAYKNLIDIQRHYPGRFEARRNIKIKKVSEAQTVWQYFDEKIGFLNKSSSKGNSSMSPTQPDLENALLSIRRSLEQITNKLDNRFTFLNGTKQIYDAVVEAINKAGQIWLTFLTGSRLCLFQTWPVLLGSDSTVTQTKMGDQVSPIKLLKRLKFWRRRSESNR